MKAKDVLLLVVSKEGFDASFNLNVQWGKKEEVDYCGAVLKERKCDGKSADVNPNAKNAGC